MDRLSVVVFYGIRRAMICIARWRHNRSPWRRPRTTTPQHKSHQHIPMFLKYNTPLVVVIIVVVDATYQRISCQNRMRNWQCLVGKELASTATTSHRPI
jgi:hypothetical protein